MKYELHPLCSLFPRMVGADFDELKADIGAHGLHQPIVLHDGMILDGGNRYRACLDVGIEPQFVAFDGAEIVAFVLSANLRRRHMTVGQQAAIVASAQDWANAQLAHRPKKGDQMITLADRAATSGASEITQRRADQVAKASPQLARQVAHGEMSLLDAVEQVTGKRPSKSERRAPDSDHSSRIAELEARNAELESEYREVLAENESLSRVLSANDQVAAALAEAKRFREQARLLNERIAGLIGERNQAVRTVRSLQRKAA